MASIDINALFDGIYNPNEICVFCEEFCENECAVRILRGAIDRSTHENKYDCLSIVKAFLGLLVKQELRLESDGRKYIIYAFISYLMQPDTLEFISRYPSLKMEVYIKRWMTEYDFLILRGECGIYENTPFLSNLNFILYYLENGGDEVKECC